MDDDRFAAAGSIRAMACPSCVRGQTYGMNLVPLALLAVFAGAALYAALGTAGRRY